MRSTTHEALIPDNKEEPKVKNQMKAFMSQNSALLGGLFFLILLSEQYANSDRTIVFRNQFVLILFEFCSAYGTVGLSMSAKPWSFSGKYCIPAKLFLMLVMFLGRLRGLPSSIDPAVSFSFKVVDDSCEDEEMVAESQLAGQIAGKVDRNGADSVDNIPVGSFRMQNVHPVWYHAYVQDEGLPRRVQSEPTRGESQRDRGPDLSRCSRTPIQSVSGRSLNLSAYSGACSMASRPVSAKESPELHTEVHL